MFSARIKNCAAAAALACAPLKRKILIQLGFPRQARLMTIVKDRRDEGHAILTIRTDKGEFVLDNLNGEIKPWTATGYRFLERQSQEDPNVWLTIGAPQGAGA
jgi:predicted transglutaminase-like cysteine proteinase